MKGSINAEPDIRERILERGDDYLVLATDGVWDVMTSQEACNIVCNCAPDLGPQVRGMGDYLVRRNWGQTEVEG